MQVYLVGGAVRDALLGLPVQDRDWVVVGTDSGQMVAQGFVPVGKDFPVFLHPQTHEEYALARTERKTAPGYRGFVVHAAPDVTLAQDLARRDLTINAMAVPVADLGNGGQFEPSQVIDPFAGVQDLARRVLRHVGPAFREDPVRILRLARLAARLADFSVAPDTLVLMRQMVAAGEVDALVPERVWQELAKGLMEAQPSRMFELLRSCGALARILPELDALWGVPQRADYHPEIDTGRHVMLVLDMSARLQTSLPVRLACLLHDLGKGATPAAQWPRHLGHEQRSVQLLLSVCQRLRVPAACRELAEVVAREHGNIHRSGDLNAAAVVRLLERCDALRQPERFAEVVLACECDARGRLGHAEAPYPQRPRLLTALAAALGIDSRRIAGEAVAAGCQGAKVGDILRQERIKAVQAELPPGASTADHAGEHAVAMSRPPIPL